MVKADLPVLETSRSYTLRLELEQAGKRACFTTTYRLTQAVASAVALMATMRAGVGPDDLPPTDNQALQRHYRRILVAGWFTAERPTPENEPFRVDQRARKRRLTTEGLQDWAEDVADILEARIHDEAVWVDRRKAYHALVRQEPDYADAHQDLVFRLFSGTSFWDPGEVGTDRDQDCSQVMGGWVADRLGTGPKTDFAGMADRYAHVAKAVGAHEPDSQGWKWLEQGIASGMGEELARALPVVLNRMDHRQALSVATLAEIHSAIVAESGSKAGKQFSQWCSAHNAGWSLDQALAAIQGALGVEDSDNMHAAFSRPGPGGGVLRPIDRWEQAGAVPDLAQLITDYMALAKVADEARQKVAKKGPRAYAMHFAEEILLPLTGAPFESDTFRTGVRTYTISTLDYAARQIAQHQARTRLTMSLRDDSSEAAAEMASLPTQAVSFLDRYVNRRRADLGGYELRRAALAGWDDVRAAWKVCGSEDERVQAVGTVQTEYRTLDQKFGDWALFAALASPRAEACWASDVLVQYQKAAEASLAMRAYKHPLLAVPSPWSNPIWNDFGASRPMVSFAARDRGDLLAKVTKKRDKALAALETVRSSKRPRPEKNADQEVKVAALEAEYSYLHQPKALKLEMLTDQAGTEVFTGNWASRRLIDDLGLESDAKPNEGISRRG